jgi:hypothetical protein
VAAKIKIKKRRLKSKHKRMQKQKKDERLITIKGCLDATF